MYKIWEVGGSTPENPTDITHVQWDYPRADPPDYRKQCAV